MLKKYCALNILKQCQYKAFSGNSCSGTVIKEICLKFVLQSGERNELEFAKL